MCVVMYWIILHGTGSVDVCMNYTMNIPTQTSVSAHLFAMRRLVHFDATHDPTLTAAYPMSVAAIHTKTSIVSSKHGMKILAPFDTRDMNPGQY